MKSTILAWKKQTPGAGHSVLGSEHSYNRPPRKVAPLKQLASSKHAEDRPYDTLSATSSALDLQPPRRRRLCTVRAAAITFILVIVVIILAAIALGVVFGVLNAQKSSKAGTNVQNSVTTAVTGSLTSSISIGSQNGVACSGYTQIDDPSRNIANVASPGQCDNGPIFNVSGGAAWIRFVGSGGTELPMSSPGINHCGAFLSGWYNDTLPIIPNTPTNGTVCFETYADICGFSLDTTVVLCSPGNFYVFRLLPIPICNARYCTA